jgi:uncharacterized membrane protein YqgA involved in biofilm formation
MNENEMEIDSSSYILKTDLDFLTQILLSSSAMTIILFSLLSFVFSYFFTGDF